MVDLTKKLLQDLDTMTSGASRVGASTDLTTYLARKLGQQRQVGATSEAVIADGTDLTPDLRTYLNQVPD